MKKLVFIKHKPSATIDEICAKIIETINLLSAQKSLIIFDLTINKNEADFSSWIAKNKELQEIEVLSQQEFFRTCNYFLRIPIEKIVRMACTNPALIMHQPTIGKILPGQNANIIVMDKNLNLLHTIINGKFYKEK